MGLLIGEQETYVNFSRGDGRAIVYTSDTTMMTKLNKLLGGQGTEWKLESESRLKSGELIGKTYSCPVSFITFRAKRPSITDEQRKARRDRLNKNRFKQNN